MYLLDDSVKVAVRLCTGPKISRCHHGNLHNDSIAAAGLFMRDDSGSPMQVAAMGCKNPPLFHYQYWVLCIYLTLLLAKMFAHTDRMLWCQQFNLSHAEAEPEQ